VYYPLKIWNVKGFPIFVLFLSNVFNLFSDILMFKNCYLFNLISNNYCNSLLSEKSSRSAKWVLADVRELRLKWDLNPRPQDRWQSVRIRHQEVMGSNPTSAEVFGLRLTLVSPRVLFWFPIIQYSELFFKKFDVWMGAQSKLLLQYFYSLI